MTVKRKNQAEFCYREIPNEEDVLALLGSDLIKDYGAAKNGEFSSQMHFHNLLEMGICRFGSGEVRIGGKTYTYQAGSMIVVPKNLSHVIISREGEKSFWEYLYINPMQFLEKRYRIGNRELNLYQELLEQPLFLEDTSKIPFLPTEVNLIMDQVRTQEYGYRQCIRGLLYALLMELVKINYAKERFQNPVLRQGMESGMNGKEQKIGKALDYIEEHYAEKICVDDIAQSAYISPAYLRKLFMEYCRMSPLQYLNSVRIHAACKLLQKMDYNISEVSRKVGYENISTFLNNFKMITGETPKQWKERSSESK